MTKTKIIATVLASVVILCGGVIGLGFGLGWFGDDDDNTPQHTHIWSEWVVKTEATVTENGLEKRTCTDCGHEATRTAAYATGTVGLKYSLINDNEYAVTGVTVGMGGIVHIPAYRKNEQGEYLPVTEIAYQAFYFYGMSVVTFAADSQITTIGDEAFYESGSITSIIIPSSVKTIGRDAFNQCTNLKSVIFAEDSNLETIGEAAFRGTGITSIVIPSSVKTIERIAFVNVTTIEAVYYGGATKDDWDNIAMAIGNDRIGDDPSRTNAVRYYYSATTPATDGNFWRYVDGVPTIW